MVIARLTHQQIKKLFYQICLEFHYCNFKELIKNGITVMFNGQRVIEKASN